MHLSRETQFHMSTATAISNSEAIRLQVFDAHLGLVTTGVARFAARWPALDSNEFLSAAMNALWVATESVDLNRHPNEIGGFLRRSIENAMTAAAHECSGLSRFSYNKGRDIMRVWESLSHELFREPTHEELAERLGMSDKDLSRALSRIEGRDRPLSLDALGEQPDPAASPADDMQNHERFSYLRRAVARLPGRMRQVVEISYFEDRSLADASRELGISRARVTILHQEALQRLRRVSGAPA